MQKKSLSTSSALLNCQLFFSKIKGFFSKPLYLFSRLNKIFVAGSFVLVFIMMAKIGVTPIFASFASECQSLGLTLVLSSSECINKNGYNYSTNPENSREVCCSFDVPSYELYTLACSQREGTVILSSVDHPISNELNMGHWVRSDYVCIKNSSQVPPPPTPPTPPIPTDCSSTILRDLYQRCAVYSPNAELAVISASECDACVVTAENCNSCCCQVRPSETNFLIACQQAGGEKIVTASEVNTQIFTKIPIWTSYGNGSDLACVKYNENYREGTCNYACSNLSSASGKITTANNCNEFTNQTNGTYSYQIADLEECARENKTCCIPGTGGVSAQNTCVKIGGIVKSFRCDDPDYPVTATGTSSDSCSQMVTDLDAAQKKCCLPKGGTTCQQLPSDFFLNLNVNNLKLQSLLDMNPLQSSSVFSDPDSRTPGNIINQALTAVVFPIAGVGLLLLILIGGFQVLSGSLGGKQNSIDLGKKRVTAAIIGFTLLFLVYWIWRLIALATGLSV